jgi:hypothetical protein
MSSLEQWLSFARLLPPSLKLWRTGPPMPRLPPPPRLRWTGWRDRPAGGGQKRGDFLGVPYPGHCPGLLSFAPLGLRSGLSILATDQVVHFLSRQAASQRAAGGGGGCEDVCGEYEGHNHFQGWGIFLGTFSQGSSCVATAWLMAGTPLGYSKWGESEPPSQSSTSCGKDENSSCHFPACIYIGYSL